MSKGFSVRLEKHLLSVKAVLYLNDPEGNEEPERIAVFVSYKACLDSIDAVQPLSTIVKHGHWIELREDHCDDNEVDYYTCSECGYSYSDNSPYCPHCGAKMNRIIG